MMLSRRGLAAVLLALMLAVLWGTHGQAEPLQLSIGEAYAKSQAGEILLVDIRSRAEWGETGVAVTARPISMHERGFLDRLDEASGGNRHAPIALICATGGRSAFLQAQLLARGFTNVYDVPAGMLGQNSKPGWIASGLPVTRLLP